MNENACLGARGHSGNAKLFVFIRGRFLSGRVSKQARVLCFWASMPFQSADVILAQKPWMAARQTVMGTASASPVTATVSLDSWGLTARKVSLIRAAHPGNSILPLLVLREQRGEVERCEGLKSGEAAMGLEGKPVLELHRGVAPLDTKYLSPARKWHWKKVRPHTSDSWRVTVAGEADSCRGGRRASQRHSYLGCETGDDSHR